MRHALLQFFMQISLPARVQLTVVVLLSISFALVSSYILHTVRDEFGQTVRANVTFKSESIALSITEAAVLGDIPSIAQTLKKRSAIDYGVKWISFDDGHGKPVIVDSPDAKIDRPEWFAHLLDLQPAVKSKAIIVGGVTYGQVNVLVDATPLENLIWNMLWRSVLGFALLLALVAWAISELLRVNLKGLSATRLMAQEIKDGHYQSRVQIAPYSPPEIIETANALNLSVERIEHLMEEMRLMAYHDSLTGLPNRRALEGRLQRALRMAQEEGSRHTFCYVDLDQFKLINDRCGHAAGDQLLSELAQVLQPVLPEDALLGRLGGDEFGLLLFNKGIYHAKVIAKLLIEAINDYVFHYKTHVYHIGASVGITSIDARSNTPGEILAQADMACYSAKQMGRNRLHVYEAAQGSMQRMQEEMDWVGWFGQAVQQDLLQLFRQRIIALNPGDEPVHYEVLLRVKRVPSVPESPLNFLLAAERYNLAPTVDRWVVRTLFGWLAKHAHDHAVYSINLSGLTLNDDYFLDFVLELMDIHEIDGRRLAFEITETAAIHKLASARSFIEGLKSRGCVFYLDDFGKGLASFSYLKQLPVDYLKIDGAFVVDMLRDPTDFAIVNAFNQIGHDLGRKTVAECAETAVHIEKLRDIGVDYVQGFAVHVPEPLPE